MLVTTDSIDEADVLDIARSRYLPMTGKSNHAWNMRMMVSSAPTTITVARRPNPLLAAGCAATAPNGEAPPAGAPAAPPVAAPAGATPVPPAGAAAPIGAPHAPQNATPSGC